MIEREMIEARVRRSQQRQTRTDDAVVLTRATYKDARPGAELPNGGRVEVEPLSGGAVPERFLAIRAGATTFGIW